jgi:hypothetical protein
LRKNNEDSLVEETNNKKRNMSFHVNPNIGRDLTARVLGSLQKEHNSVVVSLSGCSAEKLKKVCEGLHDQCGLPVQEESGWKMNCELMDGPIEGSPSQSITFFQTDDCFEGVMVSNVVRIPFHLVVGDDQAHIVRGMPRAEIVLSTKRTLVTEANMRDIAPALTETAFPIQECQFFNHLICSHPETHEQYVLATETPSGASRRHAEQVLTDSRKQQRSISIVSSAATTTALRYKCMNALHLAQSLYDADLQVQFQV